jgi:hypothetical protein
MLGNLNIMPSSGKTKEHLKILFLTDLNTRAFKGFLAAFKCFKMEEEMQKILYETFKEKKDNSGNWEYVIGSTKDWFTQMGAVSYAQGLRFTLKENERFRVVDKIDLTTILTVGGNDEKL